MSTAFVKGLSGRPLSVVGDQIVQNLIQVGQSDGVSPVSLDHTYYGVSKDGVVFSLASMTVTETGTNTQTGGIQFNVFDAGGSPSPVLEIGGEGMNITGGINVVGGNTTFETSTVEVSDKDIVLASGATTNTDLDGGGIILGNPESGTIELRYSSTENRWESSTGINIASGNSLSIGSDEVILNDTGLNIGDVSLSSGGITLSDDVSLGDNGLIIGDISLTTSLGLTIGSEISMNTSGITLGSVDPVVINTTGINIGTDLSLNTTTGLMIGDDLSLTPLGGLEIGSDISLTSTGGLEINDISLTTTGLNIGGTDPIALNPSGLTFPDLQLSTTTGLSISDNVSLDSTSLTIGPAEDVVVNNNGFSMGTFGSLTKTNGLEIGEEMSVTSDSITIGSVGSTIIDDTSLALGSDVLMNHDGLYLTNDESSIYLGGTAWKIAYDSTTQNLLFQFYDSVSGTYVTKTEMKNSS